MRVGPARRDGIGQRIGGSELAAPWSVHADEIRIAELADGLLAIALKTRPQVAAGKPHEDRRPSGMIALALQGQVDFLDGVGHAGSALNFCHPADRRSQAGQVPQP